MRIVRTVSDVRAFVAHAKREGKTVGFVPTMGFLHQGHLSLMKAAKEKTDLVIASIFVNPTQFGPGEDFETYPRDLESDAALCESVGVDMIFSPEVEEMYPEGYSATVSVDGYITQALCGAKRPGHFEGVTTVVNKLFNIVMPDFAFFGQKDAQQVAVIRKMVRDLNMSVTIVPCPIVREDDGLAMSSRNTYLSDIERQDALVLSQSIQDASDMIAKGVLDSKEIYDKMINRINSVATSRIDYVSIVDNRTLEDIDQLSGEVLIALAVYIGKTRLIDNKTFYMKA